VAQSNQIRQVKLNDDLLFFRNQLRAARAATLADAEGYQQVLFALERLGMFLTRTAKWLGHYRACIERLASVSPLAEDIPKAYPEWHTGFGVLYNEVCQARNDAFHQGAIARVLAGHAVLLALVLEDALMAEASTVSDFMVHNPLVALPSQPVSFARQQMLANSYTYLPIRMDGRWCLVSETALVICLRRESEPDTKAKNSKTGVKNRNDRLAMQLREAAREGLLDLPKAKTIAPNAPVSCAVSQLTERPLLVVTKGRPENGGGELVGILTAFDLL
jgi:CBS domain-containing protein